MDYCVLEVMINQDHTVTQKKCGQVSPSVTCIRIVESLVKMNNRFQPVRARDSAGLNRWLVMLPAQGSILVTSSMKKSRIPSFGFVLQNNAQTSKP